MHIKHLEKHINKYEYYHYQLNISEMSQTMSILHHISYDVHENMRCSDKAFTANKVTYNKYLLNENIYVEPSLKTTLVSRSFQLRKMYFLYSVLSPSLGPTFPLFYFLTGLPASSHLLQVI